MSRINTNVQSLVAARVFNANQNKLSTAMQRLATGLRINSGKDDPAGLIVSEGMRSDITGINSALENASKADSMVSTAEGALNEVSSLLNDLQGLINGSANQGSMSSDEIAANQQQIDSILDSINRISGTTEFNGKKLLDGSMDYTTNLTGTEIKDLDINSARFVGSRSVTVQVTQSALAAKLIYTGTMTSAGVTTLQITGKYGTETFSFASHTAIANVASAITAAKALTGVSAVVSGANKIRFNSTDFGADGMVSIQAITGTWSNTNTAGATVTKDNGRNPTVTINGAVANSNGLQASLRSATLDVDIVLDSVFAGKTTGSVKTFSITGGGANFNLGMSVGLASTAGVGLQSTATASLGRGDVGSLASLASGGTNQLNSKNYAVAQRIVDSAINQVSTMRGRLGAFQKYTIGSTVNSLNVALENTMAAESAIRDADFATETANMTRQQILIQAGTSALQMANQAPQSVLSLLR